MELRLSDIEANAVKHALEKYYTELGQDTRKEKGVGFETDAVKRVIQKMQSLSGASGT
jgi:hypothetical protein